MSELRERMIRDLKLAALEEGTQEVYLRAVRQLAAYYMVSPDRLSERQVQDYILYVRDELGIAKGTFEPMFLDSSSFTSTPWVMSGRCSLKKSAQAAAETAPRHPHG